MGIYIGTGLAFLLGGVVFRFASGKDAWLVPVLGEVRPWQLIFFTVGLPGLLFALVLFTVREPLRRGLGGVSAIAVPFRQVLAYGCQNPATFFSPTFAISFVAPTTSPYSPRLPPSLPH